MLERSVGIGERSVGIGLTALCNLVNRLCSSGSLLDGAGFLMVAMVEKDVVQGARMVEHSKAQCVLA